MKTFKTKDIVRSENLTLAQLRTIPKLINEWLQTDEEYTLNRLIIDQIVMFANNCTEAYAAEVIKIEKLEWVGNWKGRKNDYSSDITVWVTAIVDLGQDKIVRLSFDLFDSMIMTTDTGCSGRIAGKND